MIKRLWRLLLSIISLGMYKAEKANAPALRRRIVDEQVGKIAAAQTGLGELAGAARQQTRVVARLEEDAGRAMARKVHFMKAVQAAGPGSKAAASATTEARRNHGELVSLTEDLNGARAELVRLTSEYETSKALVVAAKGDVRDAKDKGRRMEQRQRTATRRRDLVHATSSLRGIGGIGDDLADLDEEFEAGIAALEGAALVAADMASADLADQRLDAEIAVIETDDEFAVELAALEADVVDVTSTPAPEAPALGAGSPERDLPAFKPTREAETVPAERTVNAGEDVGGGSSGRSDFGGGGGSDD